MNFRTILIGAALAVVAQPAFANSFINGNFETNTGAGQLGFNTTATGWTTTGYNFLYAPGTADTSSAASGIYGINQLWGPNNGSANGMPASSPSGGYFVGADGAFGVAPIEQVITGLTVGKTYSVGFNYAYSQQFRYNGETIQNWTVSFAGQSAKTADYTLSDHGFSGWFHSSYDFVANNATETLSFLAYGNLPVPPFALLDGVTFTPDTVGSVPEPASWAMMMVGFGLLGATARRRRRLGKAIAA
jgi:hypothetical protein